MDVLHSESGRGESAYVVQDGFHERDGHFSLLHEVVLGIFDF